MGHDESRNDASHSSEGSDLLRSVRAAFHGSRNDPDPPIQRTVYASVDGNDSEEELAWNESTVVWSIGGILRNTWSFHEEGQRIQYACFGWLRTEGTMHSKYGISRHNTDESDAEEDVSMTSPQSAGLEEDGGGRSERDVFGPFFRARRARMTTVEPTNIARAVFVFLRHFGRVFLLNGLEYSFSLPFIVRRAWPLSPHGVLLQRIVDPSELDEPDPLPSLYTFTNPFQEPRPVGFAKCIKGAHRLSETHTTIVGHDLDEQVGFSVPAEEHIVWIAPRLQDTSNSDNIIVSLDQHKTRLSFWRYAFVTESAIQQNIQDPGVFKAQGGEKSHQQTRHTANDMVSRGDRIRAPSPEFEPTQVAAPGGMGLPPFQGIPPPMTTASTLASLASSGSGLSQWPGSDGTGGRKSSLTRNDLTSTMDRMVLDRKSDIHAPGFVPILSQSILPVYWMQRLYVHELEDKE